VQPIKYIARTEKPNIRAASTSDAEVNVVGQGSRWTLNNALLAVGDDGTAAVNILDGGNVSNLNALVGADASSTGTVVVSGVGSKWNTARTITVGDFGDGTLFINAGGSVESSASSSSNDLDWQRGRLQLCGDRRRRRLDLAGTQ
jgi:T5SS/PEP-CTERM-associated repeat protein